jgi:hypothetical protein
MHNFFKFFFVGYTNMRITVYMVQKSNGQFKSCHLTVVAKSLSVPLPVLIKAYVQ